MSQSRIIKFRVWSTRWSCMVESAPLVGHGFGVTTDRFGMKMYAWADAHATKGPFEEFAPYDPKDFILQQFTGLLDKNGVEIYEGDIVEYPMWEGIDKDYVPTLFRVIWQVSEGGFRLIEVGSEDKDAYGFEQWSETTVKGNIHQNPELISPST